MSATDQNLQEPLLSKDKDIEALEIDTQSAPKVEDEGKPRRFKDYILLRDWMQPIQKYIQDFEKEKLGDNATDPKLRQYRSLKDFCEGEYDKE